MSVQNSPPKISLEDIVKGKTLVQRVKLLFKLADDTRESDKTFSNIRQIVKLITSEYFDFKTPWRLKRNQTISRTVNHCVRDILELIPICFDVNYRLMGMHLLARDLLILLCQDENRNRSRKSNTAKKERGEDIKLGRRKILKGIQCLAFLINRYPQDITLFGIIDSRYISKSSIYSTSTSHSTIRSSQFPYCCASYASPRPPPSPVTRPASVQRTRDSTTRPLKQIHSKSTAAKCMRKPSVILESASAQRLQKRRHDPETAAMIANCNLIEEEQEEQEPLKKASKKMEMNRSFFNALPKNVDVRSTYFLFLLILIAKHLWRGRPSSISIARTSI